MNQQFDIFALFQTFFFYTAMLTWDIRNKFAFCYYVRTTSECSVRRLKIRPAAGW
jgi:hypothetical protein